MEINVVVDFISFFYAILSGLSIGLMYDFYRSFRHFTKPKRILSHIEDLLFWIIVGFICFIILVKLTDGVIRGFVFGGFFLGGVLYYFILSKYIYSLILLIFKLILEMISEIIKLLIFPFKNVYRYSKKKIKNVVLIPKILVKEMVRYGKIISRKKWSKQRKRWFIWLRRKKEKALG